MSDNFEVPTTIDLALSFHAGLSYGCLARANGVDPNTAVLAQQGEGHEAAAWRAGLRQAYVAAPRSSFDLATVERRLIQAALQYCGSVQAAATQLGVSRTTMYRKLQEFGLNSRGEERQRAQ